jgi:tetratricopeptide (TPR) repeat protein
MNQSTSAMHEQNRIERIGHEVKTIRDMGLPCDLQQDASGSMHYLTVELRRETMEGAQPVRAYFKLDSTFPASTPELVVTVITAGSTASGELVELPIEIESKTRLNWSSASMLYEIVRDVQDSVQNPQLRLASSPATSEPMALPLPEERRPAPAPRRSAAATIGVVVGFSLLVLLVAGIGGYFALLHDPCGGDQQLAQQAFTKGNRESLMQAVILFESMRTRGLAGERGSCGALASDNGPLRETYERLGAVLISAGALDEAERVYGQALALDGEAPAAKAGLRAIAEARVAPLWAAVEQRWPANTEASWPEVVENLQQISAIQPEARNPTNGLSVTLQLAKAQIAWGDLLFANDLAAAAQHYANALTLLPTNSIAKERSIWIERARSLETVALAEWPARIVELEQAASAQPDQRDPAGRSINQWRYDVHLAYGRALLNAGGAVADEVRNQADAALALAAEAEDKGDAARQLKREAEALLEAASGYQISASPLAGDAWNNLLRDRQIEAAIEGRPINLVVVTPLANLAITLTSAGASQQLVTDRAGVAFAALNSGTYILTLADNKAAGEVTLNLSTAATYLVRVTLR